MRDCFSPPLLPLPPPPLPPVLGVRVVVSRAPRGMSAAGLLRGESLRTTEGEERLRGNVEDLEGGLGDVPRREEEEAEDGGGALEEERGMEMEGTAGAGDGVGAMTTVSGRDAEEEKSWIAERK